MNNSNNSKMIISREACLFYGLPGTAILAVSLILSCKVGSDLGGSTFVSSVIFLGSNLLLWLLYLILFQYLPVDLLDAWQTKKKSGDMSIDTSEETDSQLLDAKVEAAQNPIAKVQAISAEEYKNNCDEFERRKREEHHALVSSIMDYVGRVMAPFLKEEELDKLRNEIRAWCDAPDHVPQPVKVKSPSNYKDRLKSISYKHFIWNIAVRLGFGNGYSVMVQADFVKKLFPDELEDIEVNSLARSLTCDPDKGHIRLDRPRHTDGNVFHF